MLLVSALTTLSLLVTGMAPVDWGLAPAASAAPDEPVSSKDVVAADMVSAAAMARLRDAEVEVEGLRTQTARTFALPDGSVRVEEHAGIQRFRGPGGKWVEVDLDLVADPRGVLRPKAHPIGVALAGGGQAGDLVSAAAGTAEDGTARVVALGWAGEIPKPTVSGATATYPEVAKGVDAKVVVTRSGFEQFFVIKSRAAARSGLSWELPLRTEGLAVRGEVDGSVSFTDPAGEVVSRLGSASAWDASIDERVGDQRSKVSPVGMRVEQNAPDRATLRITPDPGWLLDADREFPVIIDPSYTDSSAPVFDTFVQSGVSSDQSGQSELKVGTYNGGTTKTRSFIRFDRADVAGTLVSSAHLSLHETWSYSCTASAVDAWSVTADATTATRWTAQPGLVSKVGSATVAKGYSSSCAAGRIQIPVTSLVQQWSQTTQVIGTPTGSSTLASGQTLGSGRVVVSGNGRYYLAMQSDGNLVVYGPSGPRWSSGTQGNPGAHAVMQTDGNLVVYKGSTSLWASGTHGQAGAHASMQTDGNLVVYKGGTPLWWIGAAPATPPGTIALVAANESDSNGWKRFASAETAEDPVLVYTYNTPPAVAGGLTVHPGVGSGPTYTSSLTPTLAATVSDPDPSAIVTATFEVVSPAGAVVWQTQRAGVPNGAVASVTVPSGTLTEGVQYGFRVRVEDGSAWSAWSPLATFVPDVTKPGTPFVSGAPYTNSGAWQGGTGTPGTFTFTPASGGGVTSYRWGVDKAPTDTVTADGSGAATVSWTPTTDGPHTLQVVAVDRAGNVSAPATYQVRVGQAGLISPKEGDQVVRRARLAVQGTSTLTHVRFSFRRGEGSTGQLIPVTHLRMPDGTAITGSWIEVDSLAGACPDAGGPYTQAMADFCAQTGGYARWDAGLTLGSTPGPVQIQAQFATNVSGAGAVPTTRWTTITVDPDGDGAASTDIGPASANLLTGDATLTGEDAAEFGISVGRVASSRNPAAGYRAQAERLSANQQSIGTDTSGFTGGTHATITRDTGLGHSGTDSLKIVPKGSGGDSFTTLGTADPGMASYLTAGHRFRVSGWMYVPAATGLSPSPNPNDRGLRLVAFTKTGGGGYATTISERPTVTDAWVKLTLDVDVPAGATEAFVRVYNGNNEASGKAVFIDDLSVQQLWAPFGPQWALSIDDESSDTGYDTITQPDPDTLLVHVSGGGEIGFYGNGSGGWFPQPGAEGLTLAPITGGWRLTDIDGTVTDFTAQAGATGWPVTSSSPPVQNGQTRYVYEVVNGASRPRRVIAPVEPGVDNWPVNALACTQDGTAAPLARGCEVLELEYATTTTATGSTPGSFIGQVAKVKAWSWDPTAAGGTGAVTAQVAAEYAYDSAGRLVSVVDPRLTTASSGTTQPLGYGYDSAGRITTVTPAGELPWTFSYGTAGGTVTGADDYVDANAGRLLSVSRASLTQARWNQTGYDTPGPQVRTSLVYQVPTSRVAGGPYDLDASAIAAWGQVEAPADATAVFGPDTTITSATATTSVPGPNGYASATLTYLDASGAAINTASPAGPHAPVEGYIDTAEYDIHGNVVRELEATNRLLALDKLPDAASSKAELGLAGLPTAQAALMLSQISTYSGDGIDLIRQVGPVQQLAIGNDPLDVRVVRDYEGFTYDEGKPDGKTYHLVTTETEAVQLSDNTLADVSITRNEYTPVDGSSALSGSSGWVHGEATRVTIDPDSPDAVSSSVIYDSRGRPVESRAAGSTGSDPGTRVTSLYVAGTAPDGCGSTPEWAGLPCLTTTMGSPSGHDPGRMPSSLSIKKVTGYDRNGNATLVQESSGAETRTTTTTYDAADRVVSVELTGTLGTPLGKVVTVYDNATGNTIETRTLDGAGAVVASVAKKYDSLDRMTRYVDASGAWTDTTFDAHGKPIQVVDSTGATQTFTYDRDVEPRGYLTKVTDSVAGDMTATYTPDGQVATQTLPGGVTQTNTYDAAGIQTGKTYTIVDGPDDDDLPDVLATSTIVENGSGQWVWHASSTGQRSYDYDQSGRLTSVVDQIAGGACTTRTYTFNDRAARTSRVQATQAGEGCLTPGQAASAPGATTTAYTYDTADRLVTSSGPGGSSWTYDAFGRITTAPVQASATAATVANGHYVNDLLATQEIAGVQRMEWSLDPLHRFDQVITRAWDPATSGWVEASTQRNHYDGDEDSPAWVSEDATLASDITRYVEAPDGMLAVQTGKNGGRQLQLTDLHGDVQATIDIEDGQSEVNPTTLAYLASDEYGQPIDLSTGVQKTGDGSKPAKRYQWLGGQQRSAHALAGIVLMGVRAYDPATGRFWSVDPTPGGNSTAYDYCSGDPINCTDLDGHISRKWKKRFGKLGRIAEYGSWIPGPIGTASAAISAGAYAASGNRRKAAAMGVVAAANLVGAGAAVKVGMKVATRANKTGRVSKAAKSVYGRAASWNARAKSVYGKHLVGLNGVKNRYTRNTKKGKWEYDLAGRGHFQKKPSNRIIPTPHKKYTAKGRYGYWGKVGPTKSMGWGSLMRVHYRLKRGK